MANNKRELNALREKLDELDARLRPCPFCGNGNVRMYRRPGKDGWLDRYYALCDYDDGGCGASGGWYHSPEEATDVWNRRVPEAAARVVTPFANLAKAAIEKSGEMMEILEECNERARRLRDEALLDEALLEMEERQKRDGGEGADE